MASTQTQHVPEKREGSFGKRFCGETFPLGRIRGRKPERGACHLSSGSLASGAAAPRGGDRTPNLTFHRRNAPWSPVLSTCGRTSETGRYVRGLGGGSHTPRPPLPAPALRPPQSALHLSRLSSLTRHGPSHVPDRCGPARRPHVPLLPPSWSVSAQSPKERTVEERWKPLRSPAT